MCRNKSISIRAQMNSCIGGIGQVGIASGSIAKVIFIRCTGY